LHLATSHILVTPLSYKKLSLQPHKYCNARPHKYNAYPHVSDTDLYANVAHWAKPDYGLNAGQHAVLPEGKGTLTME